MYFDLDLTPQETMVPRDPGSSGGTSNQQPFSADGKPCYDFFLHIAKPPKLEGEQ